MADVNSPRLPEQVKQKIRISPNGCWEWMAARHRTGYGRIAFNRETWLAHRLTYTLLVGAIPDGLVIDHLCRNRPCVNPEHLRAVTQWENVHAPGSLAPSAFNAKKTTCPLGHPLVRRGSTGSRACRECNWTRDRSRWPQRSVERAERRAAERKLQPELIERLVADVRAVIDPSDRITTPDLVVTLRAIGPWSSYLNAMTLRSGSYWLTAQLGVQPRTHRFGTRTTKGYRLDDLPRVGPSQSLTNEAQPNTPDACWSLSSSNTGGLRVSS